MNNENSAFLIFNLLMLRKTKKITINCPTLSKLLDEVDKNANNERKDNIGKKINDCFKK